MARKRGLDWLVRYNTYRSGDMEARWWVFMKVWRSLLCTCESGRHARCAAPEALSEQTMGSDVGTTFSDNPAGYMACSRQYKRLMASVEAKFASICAGIQRRLEGGAGVRAAFKAEVRSHLGVKITDSGVTAMIKDIAEMCAPRKAIRMAIRGSDFSSRPERFKVVKRKSRSKQFGVKKKA